MTDAVRNEYRPTSVSPPGNTIADLIEERGIKQVELAARMGVTPKFINELIAGKASISPTTALALERTLDLPADFWLTRDVRYQESQARAAAESALAAHAGWLDELPLPYLRKHGLVSNERSRTTLVAECLRFFAVASVDAWRDQYVVRTLGSAAYRASEKIEAREGAVATWLRMGEVRSASVDCVPFARDRFLEVLREVRELATDTDPGSFVPRLEALFASCGVVIALIPAPPGCPVSGAVRWLTADKALIQLSLRYRSNDILWFTLFHECGHLALHGKKILFLEGESLDGTEEAEADHFAADLLIPPEDWQRIATSPLTDAAVQYWADRLHIAPGIIVGRLQNEGLIPWKSALNRLKVRYTWQDS
jgi:addiction module HigA family antidote